MQRSIFVLALVLCAFIFPEASAQTAFAEDFGQFELNKDLLHLNNQDWSFTSKSSDDLFYIDFEKINVTLNNIKVLNNNGEVVYSDDLWNLPVNSIYELDLTAFTKGKYTIELNTFTEALTKTILLN
jgi:hypothetical protein